MIITLENGIRTIVQSIPHMHSVAMGIFVGIGSAYENDNQAGISHLVEHMMFKGTEKLSAFEVADSFDKLGSQVNAFTTKEITCYYAKSTSENSEKTFDLLCDIFCNSIFDAQELEREKGVIAEEIAMYEDNAEEVCSDLLAKEFFMGGKLGKPIIGNKEIVQSLSQKDLFDFVDKNYTAENIVIVFAGKIIPQKAEELANKYFLKRKPSGQKKPFICSSQRGSVAVRAKDIELANICMGFPSVRFDHEFSNHYYLLNIIFGGGMSSRLFQEIREKRGLAYSVYSYISSYSDCGLSTVYIGCDPKRINEALNITAELCGEFCSKGITKAEFERSTASYKSALIFGQESPTSLMNAYGKYLVMTGKEFSIEKKLKNIENIKLDELNELAKNIYNTKESVLAFVGKQEFCDKVAKLSNR